MFQQHEFPYRMDRVRPVPPPTASDTHPGQAATTVATHHARRRLRADRPRQLADLLHPHASDGCRTVTPCRFADQFAGEADRCAWCAASIRPPWAPEAFGDPATDVRQSIARIKADPFIVHKERIRGFVFYVATGELDEVN
jgi:hypothetical protein